ncbi:hypothetical protein T4B_10721 [Trichinella pseudospiralis]|uniref:Uncharacterized protein n=1 Tax=Trichinella pseudospiralis TaxID=6337 RepID=A0A0V1GKB2_TRIPS|nr:hypothetical protein T4B_10721 [Trichinella pseudospiralis]
MPSKLRFAYVNTQRSCQLFKSISSNFEPKLAVSCGINGSQKIALPMLIHMKLFRFFKISREI